MYAYSMESSQEAKRERDEIGKDQDLNSPEVQPHYVSESCL